MIVNARQLDPSGTLPLANRMIADVNVRFAKLISDIRQLFEADAFGMFGRWGQLPSGERVAAFREWVWERMKSLFLDGKPFAKYSRQAYMSGFSQTMKAVQFSRGEFVVSLPGKPSAVQTDFFVNSLVLNDTSPLTEDLRVELFAARLQQEMEGLADDAAHRAARALLEGLDRGLAPSTVAKSLEKALDVSKAKARMIARTEMVRAKAEAQLDAFDRLGEKQVGVKAEFQARSGACPRCAALDGKEMTISKARGLIPVHPNCYCRFTVIAGRARKGVRKNAPEVRIPEFRAPTPRRRPVVPLREEPIPVVEDRRPTPEEVAKVHNPETGRKSATNAVKYAGLEEYVTKGSAPLSHAQVEDLSRLVHDDWVRREQSLPGGGRPERKHLHVPYEQLSEVEKAKDRAFVLEVTAGMRPPGYWGSKAPGGQNYYRPGQNPTVDNVITRDGPNGPEVLLIRRADKEGVAERGKWALPGGFHDTEAKKGEPWKPGHETAQQAALRELKEETGLDIKTLEKQLKQVGVYEGGRRDPRDNAEAWSKSTAFKLHLTPEQGKKVVKGTDDADMARWVPTVELREMPMAFDHRKILLDAGIKMPVVKPQPKPAEPKSEKAKRLYALLDRKAELFELVHPGGKYNAVASKLHAVEWDIVSAEIDKIIPTKQAMQDFGYVRGMGWVKRPGVTKDKVLLAESVAAKELKKVGNPSVRGVLAKLEEGVTGTEELAAVLAGREWSSLSQAEQMKYRDAAKKIADLHGNVMSVGK